MVGESENSDDSKPTSLVQFQFSGFLSYMQHTQTCTHHTNTLVTLAHAHTTLATRCWIQSCMRKKLQLSDIYYVYLKEWYKTHCIDVSVAEICYLLWRGFFAISNCLESSVILMSLIWTKCSNRVTFICSSYMYRVKWYLLFNLIEWLHVTSQGAWFPNFLPHAIELHT